MLECCVRLNYLAIRFNLPGKGFKNISIMSSRRKDGGFPRRKGGNSNKPMRNDNRESGKKDNIGDMSAVNKPGTSSFRSSQHQSERPPPDLKGKALGLWFRDRQVKRNKKEEEDRIPVVTLPRNKFTEIEDLLLNVGPAGNVHNVLVDGDFKDSFLQFNRETFENKVAKFVNNVIEDDVTMNNVLKNSFIKRQSSRHYQEMLEFRKKLPSFKMKDELLQVIEKNQVVVISGETGCGKTTQVAQFVLDDYVEKGKGSLCRIICTQPRRIAAVSVAERVASERDEKLGDSIGYQIRLEKVLPKERKGSLLFVTTGILLQWIQSNPSLNGISHIFVDEIHERDIMCDFVITFLKLIIEKRPTLKLILMSATLNAEHFSKYFGGVPCIAIPGFTFPVEDIYLDQVLMRTGFKFSNDPKQRGFNRHQFTKGQDDGIFQNYVVPHVRDLASKGFITGEVANQLSDSDSERINVDLIGCLIKHICMNEGEGAILVFVPGLSEIQKIHNNLKFNSFFRNPSYLILPLHSTLPTVNQRQIFNRPPRGVRKIIIATNIAETSITIDDVVFVIDSGYIKMQNFNMAMNVATLNSHWISGANARQRRGRAGRVEAGKCFKLYTKAREDTFEPFQLPEMQRIRLEEVVLQTKLLQLGKVAPFLEKVLDPPDPKAVTLALQMLRTLNALDEDERLTPLGYHLAKLPMDPRTGKMILMAAIFGCVDPILSIAAALGFKDPFSIPLGKEPMVKQNLIRLVNGEPSDHLVISTIFRQWEEACEDRKGHEYAREYFLSGNTLNLLREMKVQFARHLHEMNFLKTTDYCDVNGNINSANIELVKAIVCAGLYPNVAMIKSIKGSRDHPTILLKTTDHPRVQFHPKSICGRMSRFDSPFFVFNLMQKSSSIFVHDATMVHPWALLFFGERLDLVEFDNVSGIRVDDMIKFNCFKKTGMLIKKLRGQLDWILASSIANPEVVDWSSRNRKSIILRAIVELITADNEEMLAMMAMDDF